MNLRSPSVYLFLVRACAPKLALSNTVRRLVRDISSICWGTETTTKAMHREITTYLFLDLMTEKSVSHPRQVTLTISVIHSSWRMHHVPLPCQGVRKTLLSLLAH